MLEEQPWKIDITDDGDALVVAPRGELDLSTSPELVDAFARSSNGHRELICDVTAITFMDSTGFQALLSLATREPQRFALAGTSPSVETLLKLTNTTERFRRVDR